MSKIGPGKVKGKDCVSDFQNQCWWCLWVFGICLSIHQIIKDKIYLRPKIDYDEVKIKICFTQKEKTLWWIEHQNIFETENKLWRTKHLKKNLRPKKD